MNDTGRFRLTLGALLGVLLIAGFSIRLSWYPLWHTDVWAHAKYGEWYSTHQTSPGVEPLSNYSDQSLPFPDVAWLSQVAYHWLFQFGASIAGGDDESRLMGGAEALRTFHLILLLGRFTLLWFALKRFGGSDNWATLGVLLYLLAVGMGSAIQRPQAFGLLFFTAVIFALSTPAISRRTLFWLPVCFGLWANMHGTFMAGLAMLGLHGIGRLIERRSFDAEVRRLILLGMLCGSATLINPHGPWIYHDLIAFSSHPNLKTMKEWHPMRFSFEAGNHWSYIMSIVLLLFVRVFGGRKVGAAGWLVALPFAVWPWIQFRMIVWWWTIAMWLLARLGPGLADRFPTMFKMFDQPASRLNAIIAVIAIAAAAVCFPPSRSLATGNSQPIMSPGTPWRLGLELSARPADHGRWLPELREALREHHADGQFQGAIFASETQGDFLVWRLPKDQPVLMFTHAHVFTEDHWQTSLLVRRGDPGWREFLERTRTNLVVVEVGSHDSLCDQLRSSPDWQVVQDGPAAEAGSVLIAVRKKPL